MNAIAKYMTEVGKNVYNVYFAMMYFEWILILW